MQSNKHVALFNIKVLMRGWNYMCFGKNEVVQVLQKRHPHVEDGSQLLPHPGLGQ